MKKTIISYIGTIFAVFAVSLAVSFSYTVITSGLSFDTGVLMASGGSDDDSSSYDDDDHEDDSDDDGGYDSRDGDDDKEHSDYGDDNDDGKDDDKEGEDDGGKDDGGGDDEGDGDDSDNSCPVDLCLNLEGVQDSVPSGYVKVGDQCVIPPADVCPNIDGVQETVPAGYIKNSEGLCVPPPDFDFCPNISGVQESIPAGYIKDGEGNCVIPPADVCPNIPGDQSQIPNGKIKDNEGNCVDVPQCVPGIPVIVSEVSISGSVGASFTYSIISDIAAEFESISLPAGLSISTSGIISGILSEAGTFEVTLKATNQCGTSEKKLLITVTSLQCTLPPPTITSDLSASGVVGSSFSYTLAATGTASFFEAENLPPGLAFDANTNVISGTPTSEGTFNSTLRVSNSCGSDQRTLAITITSGGGGGGSCNIPAPSITSLLTASGTTSEPFSYTLSATGTIDAIEVTNLPSWLGFSTSTLVLSGTPTEEGQFSINLKVSNQCGLDQETLLITIQKPPTSTPSCTNCGGGGGGGGGGFFTPTVVLMRATSSPLASFAAVYLSQVPYTGVVDTMKTILFLLALLAVSAGITYTFVYRPFAFRTVSIDPDNESDAPNHHVVLSHLSNNITSVESYTAASTYAPASFKENVSIAKREVKSFHSADIGESISEGLAAMENKFKKGGEITDSLKSLGAPESLPWSDFSDFEETKAYLKDSARASNVIIGDDGVSLILTASHGKKENSIRILSQIITVAKEWYPANGDAYLSLDSNKIRSILFSTYISMVPLFVRWMSGGSAEKTFNFIRVLNQQGHSVPDFLKAVAYELDRVYRFHVERQLGADEYSIEATKNWGKDKLESVIEILVGAFDKTYKSDYTAGKLALSRTLDLIRG